MMENYNIGISKIVISICLQLLISELSFGKTIVLCRDVDLQNQLSFENATYIIQNEFDIEGKEVSLPANSILLFRGRGKLLNGILVGNSSQIKAGKSLILDNVKIRGRWSNTEVYSQWVLLREKKCENNFAFSCLMNLCKGDTFTHFYMQEGTYCVQAIYRSAPILVPSNVYWHNNATIKMLPNELDWFNIVYLNKSDNVVIDGGCFEGDALEHKGLTGEWGHGIKCGGASNVVLRNLICRYCWGDGIDLIEGLDNINRPSINCRNITIENVKCLYNRRQGMSIEAAFDVKVKNSEFAYTGHMKKTPPSAGVDIEPWIDNCNKVWNVEFYNCKMYSNAGYDIQVTGNHVKLNSKFNNNFILNNCIANTMLVFRTSGILIKNSIISQEFKVVKSKDVLIKDSPIKRITKGIGVSKIIIEK